MSVNTSRLDKPYSYYPDVWVELTRSEHQHGGEGWEFGTCLWSPSEDKAGRDRYAIMREPVRGDLVLHIYHHTWERGVTESRLAGSSLVKEPCREISTEPPLPGDWRGAPSYYRINLASYEAFPGPLSLITLENDYGSQIRDEILGDEPRHFPFSTYGRGIRLAQGMYLARCTERLYRIFRNALSLAPVPAHDKVP